MQQVFDDEFELPLLLPHAATTANMAIHDTAIHKPNTKPRRFMASAPFNQYRRIQLRRYGYGSPESTSRSVARPDVQMAAESESAR